jgi:hypothetical protein
LGKQVKFKREAGHAEPGSPIRLLLARRGESALQQEQLNVSEETLFSGSGAQRQKK